MRMVSRGVLITLILCLIVALPVIQYRNVYTHQKRFRVVTPGKVYRSGQLTEEGFTDVVRRYNIRTIINLQDDVPDPSLPKNFFDRNTVKERELCRRLGVRYVHVAPDLLPPRQSPRKRPRAVDQFLMVMDELLANPEQHLPVLVHCRAGLHRTGCMVAVYRMEHEGWSPAEAFEEMRAHGFGDRNCTSANEYVRQYVLNYRKGKRIAVAPPTGWNDLVALRRNGNVQR